MGAGASASEGGSGYYCHRCQAMLDHLGEGGTCPECQGGFVEESANAMALAEAVHWIVSDDNSVNSTEARISNLLEDLREHLATVEGSMQGLRGGMTFTMEIPTTPKVEPAPQEVRDGIMEVRMDSALLQEMRQAPQCVVCCSDFEVGELLHRLPGCGHLFHSGCICQWLERAANCPICRCDLIEAVGLSRTSQSDASSVLLDTDRSQYTLTTAATSVSPVGTRGGLGTIGLAGLGRTRGSSPPLMSQHRRLPPRSVSHTADLISAGNGLVGGLGSINDEFQLDAETEEMLTELGSFASAGSRIDMLRPAVLQLGARQGSPSPPPPPPRRGTSSVLVGAGSAISSPTQRPSSVVRGRSSSTVETRSLSRQTSYHLPHPE